MKIGLYVRRFVLLSALLYPLVQTFGQATPPFLTVTDFASDSTTQPLVLVTGGQTSSTLGIEVTSQSRSTTSSVLPPLSTIMPQGYGGL